MREKYIYIYFGIKPYFLLSGNNKEREVKVGTKSLRNKQEKKKRKEEKLLLAGSFAPVAIGCPDHLQPY